MTSLHPAIRQRLDEVDAANRAVIATQPDGVIVFWNDGAKKLYGWTADEALGRNVMDVTPGEMSRPEAEEIMTVLNGGEPWSGEFLVRAKGGARFNVQVTDIPVTDEAGDLIGIVGISRRVTYL
jgi:PAS domain S-box-containing protein